MVVDGVGLYVVVVFVIMRGSFGGGVFCIIRNFFFGLEKIVSIFIVDFFFRSV